MRKIRNAAVVGLAAISLIAGTMAPAVADDHKDMDKGSSSVTSSSEKKDDTKKQDENTTTASGEQAAEQAEDKGEQSKAPGWNLKPSERPAPKENHTKCGQDKTNLDETPLGDRDCETNSLSSDITNGNNTSNSSVWGNRYNSNQNVTGRNLLGLEKNFSEQPVWAQIWFVVTVLGVIGSVVGLVALPLVNQAKAQGFII